MVACQQEIPGVGNPAGDFFSPEVQSALNPVVLCQERLQTWAHRGKSGGNVLESINGGGEGRVCM